MFVVELKNPQAWSLRASLLPTKYRLYWGVHHNLSYFIHHSRAGIVVPFTFLQALEFVATMTLQNVICPTAPVPRYILLFQRDTTRLHNPDHSYSPFKQSLEKGPVALGALLYLYATFTGAAVAGWLQSPTVPDIARAQMTTLPARPVLLWPRQPKCTTHFPIHRVRQAVPSVFCTNNI